MHEIAVTLLLLWSSPASAGVLNVEFKFTPYTGDQKQDHVETVPGKAQVFINNVLMADQEVGKEMVPVLFDDREIAPAVWVPVESLGRCCARAPTRFASNSSRAMRRRRITRNSLGRR